MVQTHMATSKVVIILPTYNERDNIGRMIDALQDQSLGAGHELHILIVDDSSPDGTADVVRMKQASRDLKDLTRRIPRTGANASDYCLE